MKISMNLVVQKLKPNYAFQGGDTFPTALNMERPLFYNDGDLLQENKVYICEASQMIHMDKKIPENILFLCIGKVPSHINRKTSYLCCFEENVSVYQLFNAVQKAFDYYDEWDQELQKAVNEDGNIQAALDCSYKIFRNPIVVASAEFFVVCYSNIIDQKPELGWIIDPNAQYEFSNAFKQDLEFNRARDYTEPFIFPEYITGRRNLCMNIFEREKYKYRVMIIEELRRLQVGEEELLAHFTGYIKLILSGHSILQPDMGYNLDRILADMLSNEKVDFAVIEQGFTEFGWLPAHIYCCINLKVAALDLQNLTVRFVCNHIENLISGACAFQYENNIAIFVNLTRFEGSVEDVLSKLVYFLRDSYLKAGASNEFVGFTDIRYYYYQAHIALDVGSRRKPYQWVHRFDDIALHYLIEQCCGKLPGYLVCSRKILELQKFDRKHKTEYYLTLRVYIENYLNAVKSAKALFIHRSTFLYRMEKMKEIVNFDLDDFDTLLYLMITFKIMDLTEPLSLSDNDNS